MEKVQQLKAIFPDRLPQDLAVILCLHGNDVNRAAEAILADEERATNNIANREKRPLRATKNNKWTLSSLWRQPQPQESERRAMAVREETDLQRAIAASLASSGTLQTKTAPTRPTVVSPREVQPRPTALPPTRPVATNKLAVATHNCFKSLGDNLAKELAPPPVHQYNKARQPSQAAAGKRPSRPTNSRQTRPPQQQGPAKDFAAFVNLFNPQNLLLLEAPTQEREQKKKKEQQPNKEKTIEQDHSQEELERLKNETNDACRKAIADHLESFLEDSNSTGPSYEDWVAELHPENAFLEGSNNVIIDQRFYLEDCWHWQLWKKYSAESIQTVQASRCQSQGNPENPSCFVVDAPRSINRIGSMYLPSRLCRNLTA